MKLQTKKMLRKFSRLRKYSLKLRQQTAEGPARSKCQRDIPRGSTKKHTHNFTIRLFFGPNTKEKAEQKSFFLRLRILDLRFVVEMI